MKYAILITLLLVNNPELVPREQEEQPILAVDKRIRAVFLCATTRPGATARPGVRLSTAVQRLSKIKDALTEIIG